MLVGEGYEQSRFVQSVFGKSNIKVVNVHGNWSSEPNETHPKERVDDSRFENKHENFLGAASAALGEVCPDMFAV